MERAIITSKGALRFRDLLLTVWKQCTAEFMLLGTYSSWFKTLGGCMQSVASYARNGLNFWN